LATLCKKYKGVNDSENISPSPAFEILVPILQLKIKRPEEFSQIKMFKLNKKHNSLFSYLLE